MLYFDYSNFLSKGETLQWIPFLDNGLEKQSTCPLSLPARSQIQLDLHMYIHFSTASIISQIIITRYRYTGYARWFFYAPAECFTMSCLSLAHRHFHYAYGTCALTTTTFVSRVIAQPGPCNNYNNIYCSPGIIIVTLQLTFGSISWPTHLPSLTFTTSSHSPT